MKKIIYLIIIFVLLFQKHSYSESYPIVQLCDNKDISLKSRNKYNELVLTIEQADRNLKHAYSRIGYLKRLRDVTNLGGYDPERDNKSLKQIWELEEKYLFNRDQYELKISKLRNELLLGKDGKCFK